MPRGECTTDLPHELRDLNFDFTDEELGIIVADIEATFADAERACYVQEWASDLVLQYRLARALQDALALAASLHTLAEARRE